MSSDDDAPRGGHAGWETGPIITRSLWTARLGSSPVALIRLAVSMITKPHDARSVSPGLHVSETSSEHMATVSIVDSTFELVRSPWTVWRESPARALTLSSDRT